MDERTTERRSTLEEETLWIKAFQGNDGSGFDRLVRRYQNRIFNVCYRMMGDREEAGDCAQETFVKAYRSLKNFRFASSFSTWIYTIALNTCRNRLKSSEYQYKSRMLSINPSSTKDGEGLPLDVEDPSPSPLAQLSQKERDHFIQKAIESLPEDSRTVVTLRDVEGLPYEEIAQITGYNLGTVKSKLARARQQLREKLQGVI